MFASFCFFSFCFLVRALFCVLFLTLLFPFPEVPGSREIRGGWVAGMLAWVFGLAGLAGVGPAGVIV